MTKTLKSCVLKLKVFARFRRRKQIRNHNKNCRKRQRSSGQNETDLNLTRFPKEISTWLNPRELFQIFPKFPRWPPRKFKVWNESYQMNVITLPNGRKLKKKMSTTIWKTFAQAWTSSDMDGTLHEIFLIRKILRP